ncbi:MAG: sigma-70 family RNA polymerase sigma factor [Lewinellaceae bacterium]|nr:sigma-70 family RNA polymerase sigma factor [Lewinellaceae bacterium]
MEVIGHRIPRNNRAQDDYHLVQTAVAGNQLAYAALLGRYQKTIYRFMLQRVKNPVEAEDLTMEAFEKAFFNLSSYAPTHAFSTWLFRIALNNCIDHNRKKRMPAVWFDGLFATAPASPDFGGPLTAGPTPEEVMIREQRHALIHELLNGLSEPYRRLIELRYFEEMGYEEMARHLDLPMGTVKAQLFRAKAQLHKLLKAPAAGDYLDRPRVSSKVPES